MPVLRVVLADHDAAARERFRRLVMSRAGIDIVGEATDGPSTLRVLESSTVDVVFMETNLPTIDGFTIASAISPAGPSIVFLAGEDETIRRTLAAEDLVHVTKPVTMQRIELAIARLKMAQGKRSIPITLIASKPICVFRDHDHYVSIDVAKLAAVLRHDAVSILLADNDARFCDDPFDKWVARLSPHKFLRVHENAMVNREFVKFLEYTPSGQNYAVLSDTAESRVPISRDVVQHLAGKIRKNAPQGRI